MKTTFKFKNLLKPTPEKMRKIAAALIVISQPSAGLALLADYKIASAIIGTLGILGALIANMYAVAPKNEDPK